MNNAELCVRAVIVALSAAGLTSCAVNKPGFLAKNWSDNFREFRVVPVFPPREDIQVGDIYALAVNAKENDKPQLVDSYGNPIIGLWVASMNLNQQINKFYTLRPEFPATPKDAQPSAEGVVNTNPGIAPEARGKNIFVSGTADRLRSVGFPGFLSARVTGAELGALVPAELLKYNIGVSARNARAATVSVPYAESYGLPAGDVVAAFEIAQMNIPGKTQLKDFTWQKFFGINPRYVDLTIVTEVFYARTFDVILESTSETGFSAGVPLSSESPKEQVTNKTQDSGGKEGGDAATSGSGNGSNDTATSTKDVTTTAASAAAKSVEERARAGDASLSRAQGAVTQYPGFSVQVLNSSRGDVALRRTFYRPIAIGYRGIRLRYAIEADGKQTLISSEQAGPTLTINGTVKQ